MKRTVLITRPEEDALPLAETLRARDLRVLIEPMLRIKPIRDVRIDLDGVQALLFSSSNGVRAFAALNKNRDLPVFTTGEASARVARNLGFKTVEGADGDVNGLVRVVRHKLKPDGGALFHGAGSVVAGDLASQLTGLGYNLRREVLYEAVQADELSPPLLQKLDAGEIDIVLLFSPRTVDTFLGLLKSGGKLNALSSVTALCMSRQVADAARNAPWRDIDVAERPELNAMLSLIERTTASLDGEPEIPGTVTTMPPSAATSSSKPRPTIDIDMPLSGAPTPPRRRGRWVWISAAAVALFVVLAGLATMPAWRSLLGDGREGGVDLAIPPTDEPAAQTAEAEQPVADTGSTEAASDASAETSSTEPAVPDAADSEAAATEPAETQTAASEPAAEETATPEPKPTTDAAAETTATTDSGEAETSGATETADATTDATSGSGSATATETNESSETGSTDTAATDQPAASGNDPRVDDLLARLAAIEQAINAAGGDTNGTPASPETLGAIEQRLTTLEQSGTSSAAADELATLSERVTAIEQLLIDFMTEVPAESLADVKAEVQRLIDENEGLRQQLATLTTRFEQADSTAFMLAVGRLGTALNEGRPFEPELATLQTLAGKDPALASAKPSLDTLAAYAATGAPSQIALAARFPEVARAIVQAAQQEGTATAIDPSWWDRLMGRVSELVTVRPVGEDVEGDSPAARVARAEARIAAGDLASAVAEIEQLTGAPAEAAANWLAAAKARLAVVPAFQALDALALERLGTGAGGAGTDAGTGG